MLLPAAYAGRNPTARLRLRGGTNAGSPRERRPVRLSVSKASGRGKGMVYGVLSGTATHNARPVFLAARLLCSLNDMLGNDFAVRRGDAALLHLTRNAFLNEVAKAEADFGDGCSRNGRGEMVPSVRRKNYETAIGQSATRPIAGYGCLLPGGRTHWLAPPLAACRGCSRPS